MPNGFSGSAEDWEKLEAPLLEIDELLSQFANERNMRIVKNYHNWPQRQMNWSRDGISRSLWILLANEENMTFHVAAVATLDIGGQRFLKDRWLRKDAEWCAVKEQLPEILEEGVYLLNTWTTEDLMRISQKST